MAMAGLALSALCDLGSILLGIGQTVYPEFVTNRGGQGYSFWMLGQSFILTANLPVYIFTAVFFLIWLNKANKNLTPLGAEYLEFSSGWAVGWWFIPFANLVKPFQVVREVWRESDPDIEEDAGFLSNVASGAPGYMAVWWGLWLGANISGNIAGRTIDANSAESIQLSGAVFVFAGVLGIAASVFAIMVIRDISQRQALRFSRIGLFRNQGPPPPPTFGEQA
jgi:hypothetical protein